MDGEECRHDTHTHTHTHTKARALLRPLPKRQCARLPHIRGPKGTHACSKLRKYLLLMSVPL